MQDFYAKSGLLQKETRLSKNGWLITGQIKNFATGVFGKKNKISDFLASTISEMREVTRFRKSYAGTTVLLLSV